MKEKNKIEPLQKKDIETVVNLVRDSFEKNYLIPSIYRGDGIGIFISSEIENKYSPYRYFVFKQNDIVAGYAEFKIYEDDSTAFLNMICVSNKFKNQGIGKKVYDYAKLYFIEKGFKWMKLDVYKSNTVAFNWYENYGFVAENSTFLYEIKNTVFQKPLANIYIQNFPQYKAMQILYGFYFLDIVIEKESIKLGSIGNDFIVRGSYSQLLEQHLGFLTSEFHKEKVYFLSNENLPQKFQIIDTIIRMKLNLTL